MSRERVILDHDVPNQETGTRQHLTKQDRQKGSTMIEFCDDHVKIDGYTVRVQGEWIQVRDEGGFLVGSIPTDGSEASSK